MDQALPQLGAEAPIERKWTHADTMRQLGYLGLHTADWAQTKHIARNPDRFHEKNPILGRHPSAGDVDKYFAATGVAHAVVAALLNRKYRELFQNGTIGLEALMVGRNAGLGVKMDF